MIAIIAFVSTIAIIVVNTCFKGSSLMATHQGNGNTWYNLHEAIKQYRARSRTVAMTTTPKCHEATLKVRAHKCLTSIQMHTHKCDVKKPCECIHVHHRPSANKRHNHTLSPVGRTPRMNQHHESSIIIHHLHNHHQHLPVPPPSVNKSAPATAARSWPRVGPQECLNHAMTGYDSLPVEATLWSLSASKISKLQTCSVWQHARCFGAEGPRNSGCTAHGPRRRRGFEIIIASLWSIIICHHYDGQSTMLDHHVRVCVSLTCFLYQVFVTLSLALLLLSIVVHD